MSRRETTAEAGEGTAAKGPYDRQGPIRVSFGVYVISLLVAGIVVFIIMLVQFLPGHSMNHRFETAVKNADYVYIGIRIPKEELKEREVNPLTKEDDVVKLLKEMGAKRAKVEINPDLTKIPGE